MEKFGSEFTPNMEYLYEDMIASLGQLPKEMRGFLFGVDGEEDFDWIVTVADYIILEYIKYSFDYDDPEYPLKHFIDYLDDSERMMQSRIIQYAMKYKQRQLKEIGGAPPGHKFANLSMDTMEARKKGHRLTEMNFFEHQNIHDLEIVKAIVERRITSAKKISNERFREIFEQYDKWVLGLKERSENSDEDTVFSSISFFTLEWHYAIEMMYYLSCLMEEEGLDNLDREDLVLICGDVSIESIFGGWFSTNSRMVKERFFVLDYLFRPGVDEFNREVMRHMIKEIIALGVRYKEIIGADEVLYRDWFREHSDKTDWASFLRYYNIFAIWQEKEWTNKRIKNMRKLFDLVLRPKA